MLILQFGGEKPTTIQRLNDVEGNISYLHSRIVAQSDTSFYNTLAIMVILLIMIVVYMKFFR